MIQIMSILALIIGLLVCLWVFWGVRLGFALILLYFSHIRTKEQFLNLYDLADDESTYIINTELGKLKAKSYAEYLKMHSATRPKAYKHFLGYYQLLQRTMYTRMLPALLIPALFFWTNWYWYLLGAVAMLTMRYLYNRFVWGRTTGYYQKMTIGAVIISNKHKITSIKEK